MRSCVVTTGKLPLAKPSANALTSPSGTGLIDTHSVANMIGSVPEEKAKRAASRYDAVIATFIGLLAVSVAAYTAYMQRQQVRAAVWPILEFESGNGPIHFTLANKGVGPAIVKHVIVKVDDQPVRNWAEVLEKILGPGYHPGEEADMSGRALQAGESIEVFNTIDYANITKPYDKCNQHSD